MLVAFLAMLARRVGGPRLLALSPVPVPAVPVTA
jgi:hypothetical protein